MKLEVKNLLNNRIVRILILLFIAIIACIPLFTDGIEGHFGQDLGFHLNRIEGIVTELKAGHFPVKMESNWMDGYGYPVAIYYGDLFLYIPAILRLLGLGVVSAYKCYVFIISFATVAITYVCFRKIFNRIDIALVCSLIYTLSSYRIVNVYIRAAVGEYSAMAFFPIMMLAMYIIYKSDKEISIYKQFLNASLLTFGVTGLINTHMLSLEIVGIVLIVFCIINFKKTFTKSVLITYVIAGVEIVIVNLFYIVPFVDYFTNESVNINNVVNNARTIQQSGLHIWEYFSFFKIPFANIEGVGDDRLLLTPGIIPIAILIMGIVFWILGKTNKEMKITIISVVALLFISSCYFPWDFLSTNTKVGDFLAQVQFPWRYMGIVIILLTFLSGRLFERIDKEIVLKTFYIVIAAVSLVTITWFTYEYKKYGELVTYETEKDLDSADMGYIEYLRSGTEREEFTYNVTTTGDVSAGEVYRNGTDREYSVASGAEGGEVTLPVVNYKGYELKSSNNDNIEIHDGKNNLIAFNVEPNYVGNIQLQFVQPTYWIIAEIISIIGMIIIVVCIIITLKNKMEDEK